MRERGRMVNDVLQCCGQVGCWLLLWEKLETIGGEVGNGKWDMGPVSGRTVPRSAAHLISAAISM